MKLSMLYLATAIFNCPCCFGSLVHTKRITLQLMFLIVLNKQNTWTTSWATCEISNCWHDVFLSWDYSRDVICASVLEFLGLFLFCFVNSPDSVWWNDMFRILFRMTSISRNKLFTCVVLLHFDILLPISSWMWTLNPCTTFLVLGSRSHYLSAKTPENL